MTLSIPKLDSALTYVSWVMYNIREMLNPSTNIPTNHVTFT